MAPAPVYFSLRQVLEIYLVLCLFTCCLLYHVSSSSSSDNSDSDHLPITTSTKQFIGSRKLLSLLEQQQQQQQVQQLLPGKKKKEGKEKKNLGAAKNVTEPINIAASSNYDIRVIPKSKSNSNLSSTSTNKKNQFTKLTNSSIEKKKLLLNSTTSKPFPKYSAKSLSAASTYIINKEPLELLDPLLLKLPKNKTTKKLSSSSTNQTQTQSKKQQLEEEDDDDFLVSELRDLPSKFQQTLLPDLERISSKYLTKANKEMTKGFKPIVGNKYAATIASLLSFFAFILIPLLLVSLIVNRIKAYFSLHKNILIFIQVYLAIYFSILCLSSLLTGLDPLKFFYATSRSTYICLMLLQTLGYVIYLLLLLMFLILVFSTDCGMGTKFLGLAQTFVGFSVGLHYYVAVFHRVVLHQPPKTHWKLHGVYATSFLLICLSAAAVESRKKAYLEDGGREGKKS